MTELLISAVLALTAPQTQADQFSIAYQRSIENGSPMVILLGAKWCPSCEVMRKEIMPLVEKSGVLEHVEYVYIDIDRNRSLAAKLSKAKTIPQLIRYYKTPDGWKYNLLNGAYKVDEVKSFIQTGSIHPLALNEKIIEKPKNSNGVKKTLHISHRHGRQTK